MGQARSINRLKNLFAWKILYVEIHESLGPLESQFLGQCSGLPQKTTQLVVPGNPKRQFPSLHSKKFSIGQKLRPMFILTSARNIGISALFVNIGISAIGKHFQCRYDILSYENIGNIGILTITNIGVSAYRQKCHIGTPLPKTGPQVDQDSGDLHIILHGPHLEDNCEIP